MIYAYCRISTSHQTVCNQKHEIQKFANQNNIIIDKWIEEIISSKITSDVRPGSEEEKWLNVFLKKK